MKLPNPLAPALQVVRSLPGAGLAARGRTMLEDALLGPFIQIAVRLNGQNRNGEAAALERGPETEYDPESPVPQISQLLERALEQTRPEGLKSLLSFIAGQLLPDEARLLAAMSDSEGYPVIHVEITARGRSAAHKVATVSTLGRAAGISVPDSLPFYLAHLGSLGLVETAGEQPHNEDRYGMLEAEEAVRSALKEAKPLGRRAAKVIRASVRLTEFGQAVWRECAPHM